MVDSPSQKWWIPVVVTFPGRWVGVRWGAGCHVFQRDPQAGVHDTCGVWHLGWGGVFFWGSWQNIVFFFSKWREEDERKNLYNYNPLLENGCLVWGFWFFSLFSEPFKKPKWFQMHGFIGRKITVTKQNEILAKTVLSAMDICNVG